MVAEPPVDYRDVRVAYDTVAEDYAAKLPDTRPEQALDLAMVDAFVEAVRGFRGIGCGMATESSYTIAPLSPETWSAFDALVQRHNGIFGGCWCIWFHPDGPERGQGAEANRALKKAYVEQGKAHAALVMDGDEAIAWAEYGTPVELPTLHHRKEYDATKTADPDYRITCVFVDKRHRRRGVTELAITGALDLIAQAGGGRVESYPHDLTNQTKKMSSSFLYNGTRRLYERLGFTYDRPKGLKNCVMVKMVDPA